MGKHQRYHEREQGRQHEQAEQYERLPTPAEGLMRQDVIVIAGVAAASASSVPEDSED